MPLRSRPVRLFALPTAALLGAVAWSAPAAGAVHCIADGDVAGLQQALDSAAASAEDDTIRLEMGGYDISAGLAYPLAPGFRAGTLRLLGGHQAGCSVMSGMPDQTILLGQFAESSRLRIPDTGQDLELSNFALLRSRGLQVIGGERACRGPRGLLRLHRVRLEESIASGALLSPRCLRIRVENVVARDNAFSGLDVFPLASDLRFEMVHSTLVGNNFGLTYFAAGGTPPDMARVANSILRSNGTEDLQLAGARLSLRNSMYTTVSGSLSAVGTVTGDPLLDSNGRPMAGSPALAAGAEAIAGGMPRRSFGTELRTSGRPDIGAYAVSTLPPAIAVTVNGDGPGPGTLRAAILQANATPGRERIDFDLPGTSCHKIIALTQPLPTITDGLVIDGDTQDGSGGAQNGSPHGFDADVCIQIQNLDPLGNPLAHAIAIETTASDDAVILRGLAFGGFGTGTDDQSAAVVVRDGRGHRIEGSQFSGDVGSLTLLDNVRDVLIAGPVRGVVVGGIDPARRNYFGAGGVGLRGDARVVEVVGNLMGTDRTGTQSSGAVPAGSYGVHITDSPNNLVLDNTLAALNLTGVQIDGGASSNNRVQDNRIGIGAVGETALGNGRHGIAIGAGQDTLIAGNTIAHNALDGVQVEAGLGHRIEHNRIHGNGGLGIDLGTDGATPNDDDADPLATTRPNRAINAPLLDEASGLPFDGEAAGRLSSIAGDYVVEFHASDACDDGGRGEGGTPVGSVLVQLAGNGQVEAAFEATLATTTSLGDRFLTATARDADGNTSEFSTCLAYALVNGIFRDGFETP